MLDDHFTRQTRDLIELILHGHTFDDVTIGDPSTNLRQDGQRIGIPLDELLTDSNPIAIADLNLGTIDHGILLPLTTVLVNDRDLGVAAHHNPYAVLVSDGDSRGRDI